MNIKNWKVIEHSEWDKLVSSTYERIYKFQQQDDCKDRGVYHFIVPFDDEDDEMNDEIPEKVNGDIKGVKFDVWLNRDPNQPILNQRYDFEHRIFWERNFYPNFQKVANDLHSKGLIEAGEYTINIDW